MKGRIPPLVLALVLCASGCVTTPRTVSRVVLDAGHGGHDKGAAVAGVEEKWLALDLALRLNQELRSKGITTVMTRRDDTFLPLMQRVAISNAQPRDAVFVSLHFNAARNRGACGLETFYSSAQGAELARLVQRRMLRTPGGRDRGVKPANFRVLRYNRRPAILVEGGFLTNSAERQRCTKGSYRQALAESIAKGILDYKKARDKAR